MSRAGVIAVIAATAALAAPAAASAGLQRSGFNSAACQPNGTVIELGGGCVLILVTNTLSSTTLTLGSNGFDDASGEWTSDQPPPTSIRPEFTDTVVATSTAPGPFTPISGHLYYTGATGLAMNFLWSPTEGNDATIGCGATPCTYAWNASNTGIPPPFERACGGLSCSNRSLRIGVLYGEGSQLHPQLVVAARQTLSRALASGVPFTLSTPRPGTLDATLLLDRPNGPALVGGRLRRAVRAGRAAHVLRLNALGRRLVRGGRRAFVLNVAVRDAAGQTRTDGARLALR
jgi:hypothetical protein